MEGKTIKMKAMKPTHNLQLRQLVAENTMLKQRLLAADKEQRSVDYWKAVVNVVVVELQKIDKEKVSKDTPFSDIIDQIANNIVKELTEREKAMLAGKKFNIEQKKDNDESE